MIWSLVEATCRALEPEERQAVLGDLTESGQTGMRGLLAVLGLVGRRQLGLWKSWRPWAGLLGLLPVLMALSSVAWSIDGILARYPWERARQSHLEIWLMTFCAAVLTVVCSWAVGFVIRDLVRRAFAVAAAFLLAGVLWQACHGQAAITSFGSILTALPPLLLCVAPFVHGLRFGANRDRLPPGRTLLLAAAALLLLIALVPFQWPSAKDLLISAFFGWPVLYLLATARRRVPSVN